MPIPRFDDVAEAPLTTDDLILDRVRALVGGAYRRQLWLMFLDERQRQVPIVMPIDVPSAPNHEHRAGLRTLIAHLVDEIRPSGIIVVLERPGPDVVRHGDQAWFALLDDACRAAPVHLRGPVLAHDDGFRWIAVEDYLVAK